MKTTINYNHGTSPRPVLPDAGDVTLLTPPYGYGVQHYEMETGAVTPSTDGDIALREIVHLLEDEG